MPKVMDQKENIKRAEDYISSMIGTMMSISAVLITISVMILAIIKGWHSNLIKLTITSCVLISVGIFIFSFWQGMKSYGYLITATIKGEKGFEKARLPLWKYLKVLMCGLIFLGIACLIFFLSTLSTFIKSSDIMHKIITIPFIFKIINSLGYIFIVIGSIGMICFAIKFPLSGRIKDLKLVSVRLLGINGYYVWLWSWILILLGSAIQILIIWII